MPDEGVEKTLNIIHSRRCWQPWTSFAHDKKAVNAFKGSVLFHISHLDCCTIIFYTPGYVLYQTFIVPKQDHILYNVECGFSQEYSYSPTSRL